jgi:hypothetical protein
MHARGFVGVIHVLVAALSVIGPLGAGVRSAAGQPGDRPDLLRQAVRDVEREGVVREATRAVDRYLETWNTRDPLAWAGSLHFPHVRPGLGPVRLTHTPEEYVRGVDFERTIASGWHRSQWDSYDVFQVGPTKAHVAGHYSRYNIEGEQIRTTVITYVVTKQGDRWGIQSRFAAGPADITAGERAESVAAAAAAVAAYFEAFNGPTDTDRWAATLNYPHVRVADGAVEMWETAEEYVNGTQGSRQRTWVHTRLDWAEPVQVGAGGVNVAVRFSRLNRLGETLSSYEAVYLVTNRDGHIGIQARSSFAP